METEERKSHWEKIYQTKQPTEVSWYQDKPTTSLELIKQLNLPKTAQIFDNGGGDSFLVDHLLKLGYENITVQDISEAALERAKKRLGNDAAKIEWLVCDEAQCNPPGQYDLWHDRAAFHFLTEENEIKNYIKTITKCIKPNGHFIIATFSEQGPLKCSGLVVKQYSESSMTLLLKDSFEKEECFTTDHLTPFNTVQNFLFCSFKRKKMNRKLSVEEIHDLDPYQFMAELGKQVIHPGGKRSTKEVYSMANLQPGQRVLDIGCGVGTTAIEIVKKFGCSVVASDIDPNMIDKANENINRAGLSDKIKIVKADIQQMPFGNNEFDVVIVEAVTMFVNRKKAVEEIRRVCKTGGKVVEHEFIWRKKPTAEARRIFEGEVCPGIKFDTAEDWIKLFEDHGFKNENSRTGNFVMMSVGGFLNDEGIGGTLKLMAKTFSRIAYMKKMFWLMPRIMKVKDSLGYIVLAGQKIS